MRLVKNIAIIVLSLSIALAGIPAYAHQQCLGHHHETQHADATSAHHDHDKAHGDQEKCCLSCSISAILPSETLALPHSVGTTDNQYPVTQALLSRFLQTQDRPPKLFS
ncbi:MAG: hypothetical protein KGJ21_07825 [Pseudomonadota bacterium]|nr:hypothetical protein [Pseudomonadota bacterium]